MGMTSTDVASLAGVTVRTAQRWDKQNTPPPDVASMMLRRWASYAKTVGEARELMRAEVDEHGALDDMTLTRYVDDAQAARAGESLNAREYGALLGHVLMALTLEGVVVDVDYCVSED